MHRTVTAELRVGRFPKETRIIEVSKVIHFAECIFSNISIMLLQQKRLVSQE